MEEEVFCPNGVCGACRWESCLSWEANALFRKCCSSADNSDELLALLSLVLQPPASASARAWTTLRSSSIESPAVFPLSIILLRSCGCCSFFFLTGSIVFDQAVWSICHALNVNLTEKRFVLDTHKVDDLVNGEGINSTVATIYWRIWQPFDGGSWLVSSRQERIARCWRR